jgi:hypothetical protein
MNAVISRFVFLALLAPLMLYAATATHPPLTVLIDFEAPHSEASLTSLRASLNQLLSPGHMSVDVQLKSDLADHPQFGELVIFKMKGSCTLVTAEPPGPIYDERGPLALAYTSEGQVLHFGEVECDRVRGSLQRIFGRDASLKNQQTYGSALAVVMAHEVYHMLGNARNHTHKGLTKPELSASELIDTRMAMSAAALDTIEKTLGSGVVDH